MSGRAPQKPWPATKGSLLVEKRWQINPRGFQGVCPLSPEVGDESGDQ